MLVCPSRRFLILLPARCGTTSVKAAIKDRFLCREFGANHGLNIRPEHRSFYKVCLTRNPYTRVLSMWRHWRDRRIVGYQGGLDQAVETRITRPQISFADLLDQPHTRRILLEVCPPIAAATRSLKIDLWVAQEQLASRIQRLPFLDGQELHLPQHHKSHYEQSWRGFYTPQLQEQVYQLYEDDFDVFGYAKELPE